MNAEKSMLFSVLMVCALLLSGCECGSEDRDNNGNGNNVIEAPGSLAAESVSASRIYLSWNDNSGNETGFRIERSIDSNFTSAVLIEIAEDTATYRDSGLNENTEYHFRIKAYNDAIESDYSNIASAATSQSQGQSSLKAITVWAYPDSVSLPYRDSNNEVTSDTAYIGVTAYHTTGIAHVGFAINGGDETYVPEETINPETDEYEFVFELNPTSLSSDGSYVITATAYPNDGEATDLPNLTIHKDTAPHSVLYAGGGGYSTLDEACNAAGEGDIIKVRAGAYALPDQSGYDFTKYVTIMPDDGASVSIRDGSLRSSYLKFAGVTFDLSSAPNAAIISSQYTHFWFDNCTAIGYGKDEPGNNASAFRFYTNSEYVVIENCTIHDASLGATLTAGNYIFRNNHVYDVTSDGVGYDGHNILITNNEIHDNLLPPGGAQHCDFIQSNSGSDQAVLRNNKCYNGDHQGNKFGGYSDRDQPYSNIAFVNNLMALRAQDSVNLRLQARGQTYTNILIEYNTIWNGSSVFYIEPDPALNDVVIRNNIFGPKEVHDMSGFNGIAIDYNCYNTGTATGGNSIVGDPLFNDSVNWDFTLQNGSPCIGKADISSGIFYDLNMNERDASPDIGAYEY